MRWEEGEEKMLLPVRAVPNTIKISEFEAAADDAAAAEEEEEEEEEDEEEDDDDDDDERDETDPAHEYQYASDYE